MNIQYTDHKNDPDAECKRTMNTMWPIGPGSLEFIAPECAKHDVEYHDGLEGWNEGTDRTFSLFDMDDKPLGVFLVSYEMEPRFSAERRVEGGSP